ncbi:MAG: type III secretion fhipep protein [Chloroflexi bacterium]|nr:type III secretion fhipep protein [Chloroflexota bacterium]
MAKLTEVSGILRPARFSRLLLEALAASDGRRKRRKRNTEPDAIGLNLKRDVLERALADDPAPEDFEGWLLAQALGAAASGPVRAVCGEILDEYRFAQHAPHFAEWLQAGAPSADAERIPPK